MSTTRIYNAPFTCRDHRQRNVTIWLRLYRIDSGPLVAIATEQQARPALSTVAADIATAISAQFGQQGEELLWWEHYPKQSRDEDDEYNRVVFRWTGTRYTEVTSQYSGRAAIEQVLGIPLED